MGAGRTEVVARERSEEQFKEWIARRDEEEGRRERTRGGSRGKRKWMDEEERRKRIGYDRRWLDEGMWRKGKSLKAVQQSNAEEWTHFLTVAYEKRPFKGPK